MREAQAPIRLLVVEDSELDAELIVAEIERGGFPIEWRRVDDERAFEAALTGFAPDVIVSDLSMPAFSGYRALEIAHAKVPDIPFLFVSGTMGEEAAVEAVRGGATDYVLKHNLARLPASFRRALREAEERRARAQAESSLLRAQRYEGLALLASGLSHDLRNVLQPITMGASMLFEIDDERAHKIGALVQDCASRGLDIIHSMLTFARGARVAVERVKMRTLLEGLTLLLRGSAPRNVELVIALPDSDIEIDGNYTELQQCLLNLCLNALQAMPEGGRLEIGGGREDLRDEFFQEGENPAPGAYLRLSISDTGTGMSDEVKANLFKAFFTTKEQGTGLGLLSCRRILDNHKSYLRVESAMGKGSTFSLYFPLCATRAAQAASIEEAPQGAGQRILVVMEEAGKLSLLADVLRASGYVVFAAQSGSAALLEIESNGLPDLVLMKADMSLMTGVSTLSALLDRSYSGPVIMIVRPGYRPSADELPPVERIRFVERPIESATLLAAVAEELAAYGDDTRVPRDG
ncbi:MAG TPA: response regulator [Rhodanobacteraceae bacterium]|nr:response regulator [Rhodanobacteraceae bacterium]